MEKNVGQIKVDHDFLNYMIQRNVLYNCSVLLTFFGVRNLKIQKFGSLFVSDESEPKINFRFFYRFFVNFSGVI